MRKLRLIFTQTSMRPAAFVGLGLVGVTVGLSVGLSAPAAAAVPTVTTCRDARGTPVLKIESRRLRNVGIATRTRDGRPIMVFNPVIMSRFSAATQRFWYFHECAHHALGHSLGHRPQSRERDADCWAIRQMRRRGMVNKRILGQIQRDLKRLGGDGVLYLPGPERGRHLNACLNNTAYRYNDPNYRAHARYRQNRRTPGQYQPGSGQRPPIRRYQPGRSLGPYPMEEGPTAENRYQPRYRTQRPQRRYLPPGGDGFRGRTRNSPSPYDRDRTRVPDDVNGPGQYR